MQLLHTWNQSSFPRTRRYVGAMIKHDLASLHNDAKPAQKMGMLSLCVCGVTDLTYCNNYSEWSLVHTSKSHTPTQVVTHSAEFCGLSEAIRLSLGFEPHLCESLWLQQQQSCSCTQLHWLEVVLCNTACHDAPLHVCTMLESQALPLIVSHSSGLMPHLCTAQDSCLSSAQLRTHASALH